MRIQILLLLSCLFLFSCSDNHRQRQELFQKWIEQNGKIKVLSTTGMINDLVKQVGGEYVDALTLIQGELDPHSYQLVKGDDEKLAIAQILFFNGLGLEHGPSLQNYLKDNPNAVGLGDRIYNDKPEEIIFIRNQKDPHIWTDISLWSQTLPYIVKALSDRDPSHASYYAENAAKFKQQMDETHEEVKKLMHQVEPAKRFLVTSHDAFNYFTRAYLSEPGERESGEWRKRFAAPEGLSPESQLSTTDIKEIIKYLKEYRIQRIFPESNVSRHSIKKIIQAAQEEGIDVKIACCFLYGDAMGAPGSEGDTYLKMIRYNGKTLSEHMYD